MSKFLASIPSCSQYLSVFSEHGFTTFAKLLATLRDSQLVDMKVKTGHVRLILNTLQHYRESPVFINALHSTRSELEEISKGEFDIKQLSPQSDDAVYYIGSGCDGYVFISSYKGKSVAVKVFYKKSGQQEGKLLQPLRHENILFVLGYSSNLLVMELAGQRSLYHLLHGLPSSPLLPWKRRIEIARGVAKGLSYLHLHSIPHGALRSSHILLRTDGSCFLTGVGGGTNHETRMNWLAPEMFLKEGNANASADIYSFGMILYELFTRQIPWRELSSLAIMKRLLDQKDHPVVFSEKDCDAMMGCPQSLLVLMQKCWNWDPTRRPTIDEVMNELFML